MIEKHNIALQLIKYPELLGGMRGPFMEGVPIVSALYWSGCIVLVGFPPWASPPARGLSNFCFF